MIVRIIKNWSDINILRQTPGNTGIWNNIRFTTDSVDQSDYVIVLNHPPEDTRIYCPRQHIWAIIQEPPNEFFKSMHRGDPNFYRIYTTDDTLSDSRYILSQPVLPWHINRNYDFLKSCKIPSKTNLISAVVSNKTQFRGQRDRINFLSIIRNNIEFDHFGRGFNFIHDKWDGLAPYKYSFTIENYSNKYYWSEKLADCFLTWTMPIYYGCKNITDYFPEEAMILIDIHGENTIDIIQEKISERIWENNIDAIAYARQLILDKYQFFPFIHDEILSHERSGCENHHSVPEGILLQEKLRTQKTWNESLKILWRRITPRMFRYWLAKIRQIIIE